MCGMTFWMIFLFYLFFFLYKYKNNIDEIENVVSPAFALEASRTLIPYDTLPSKRILFGSSFKHSQNLLFES